MLPKHLTTFSLVMVMWGAFLVPNVFAQSNSFLILGQGQSNVIDNSCVVSGSNCLQAYTLNLGNGYSGTSTEMILVLQSTSWQNSTMGVNVALMGYLNSNYTTVVSECDNDAALIPDGTVLNGPTDLTDIYPQSGFGCKIYPQYYYQFNVTYISHGGFPLSFNYAGSSFAKFVVSFQDTVSSVVNPAFAVVGGNFQISPTASSSGVFLSGAIDFCNNAMGSTTGIGAIFGNGLCIALGFLFVPNQASIQQYQDFNGILSQHLPFSYIYDIAALYNNLNASSSNFVNISFNLSSSTVKNTSIGSIIPPVVALSTTTISTYISSSTLAVLRTLMASTIWISLGYYFFRRAQTIVALP